MAGERREVCIGIGVDLVAVRRVEQYIQNGGSTFTSTVWTALELQYCDGSFEKLAVRWAAKEAVMKALGYGLGDIDPIDIEVLSRVGYAPDVELHRSAQSVAERTNVSRVLLSLSHDAGNAIAYAAIFSREPSVRS